ncbi:telomere length regulation protein TEL2 homolog [Rhineura floridana]|uniref:telomere length regulation protein TEL2 homolog n=1 Tax=Rhineura floridana TaxID=261503 RepID=UPI002AC834B5|nr:telomere length regulation protein TEL2 homolog [Rhineura floridana]XP_061455955.1 telomere length regulation protein TEL2 homolog [Rhineura floridana]XP_061455956.1 telomere length regulation protein TEL2 homolog [Rhineura floridana]XP_061455957.1 telomere length regulation protein TEL2 homolog [Rhineura floridana]
MDSDLLHVRQIVQEAVGTLLCSRDAAQISKTLWTIRSYLGGTENPLSVREKEEFIRNHFTTFLQCLISKLSPDWLEQIQSDKELWVCFFLEGPADQSFMVLLDTIISTEPSFRLNKVVDVLEQFLQRSGLSALMWEICKQQTQADCLALQEAILNKVACLPDHLGNKLQGENRPVFFPQNYFPLLGVEIVQVLERIFDSLRGGLDCSISFVSQVLGKVCVHGRRKEILNALVPHLTDRTQSDCIWQRICWRLLESVPDRWIEAVICGFVQAATGPAVLSQLLGNLVVKSKKAQFVMTQKMLLLQYSYPTVVLQNLLGYLALDSMGRSFLTKVLKELLETWGSSTAVKHSPAEQQLYISKAILICLSHLKEAEIMGDRQELLTSMMEGMKCHLDSNLPRIRHMGMVVAECVSARVTPEGPALKFQYEEDDEIRELKSLLIQRPEQMPVSDPPSSGNSRLAITPNAVLKPSVKPHPGASEGLDQGGDSELDSDDDLVPYDMSEDKELKKIKAPTYIRDCIEILTGPEDPDKYEATMSILESLIRRNAAAAQEVSVEVAKVLLHLEEKSYIEGFVGLRQSALVAIAVTDPIPVAQYLTSEFYSLNYSLRQRMDILDVLAMAAQELSRPFSPKPKQLPSPKHPSIQILSSNTSSPDWQKVVDERIKSKTRRFAKGHSQPEPPSAPNRFGPVAGHFFFPLLQNFDRPLTTFDLLGDDHLVLGRMTHTLAILMYFAVNTVVAAAMGKALLDFVWTLRFHTDTYVRQGLLSSVSSTLLSISAECLLEEMTEELLETQAWLADVAEKDPDGNCRSLALQNLLLMESLKKKKLERF